MNSLLQQMDKLSSLRRDMSTELLAVRAQLAESQKECAALRRAGPVSSMESSDKSSDLEEDLLFECLKTSLDQSLSIGRVSSPVPEVPTLQQQADIQPGGTTRTETAVVVETLSLVDECPKSLGKGQHKSTKTPSLEACQAPQTPQLRKPQSSLVRESKQKQTPTPTDMAQQAKVLKKSVIVGRSASIERLKTARAADSKDQLMEIARRNAKQMGCFQFRFSSSLKPVESVASTADNAGGTATAALNHSEPLPPPPLPDDEARSQIVQLPMELLSSCEDHVATDDSYILCDENESASVDEEDFSASDKEALLKLANEIFARNANSISDTEAAQRVVVESEPQPTVEPSASELHVVSSTVSKKEKRQRLVWKEYVDAASGGVYYHNRVTGETTWTSPTPEELKMIM